MTSLATLFTITLVMTPQQLRDALAARGLNTQVEAAKALGVSKMAVNYWLRGQRPISQIVEMALSAIPLVKRSRDSKPTRKGSK